MMKKIITLLLTCFLIAGTAATLQAQSPISLGLKGGLNIADLTNLDSDTDTRTGFLAGVSLDIDVPVLPVGVETGVYYTQKGTSESGSTGTGTIKLDYIEIPVLAKLYLGAPGPISPHFMAGPYLGFNTNAEIEGSDNGNSVTFDISDDTKSTEFGLLVGAGLDFNIGVTTLNAGVRYGFGLTNVFEDDEDDNIKNSVFGIAVGIKF